MLRGVGNDMCELAISVDDTRRRIGGVDAGGGFLRICERVEVLAYLRGHRASL